MRKYILTLILGISLASASFGHTSQSDENQTWSEYFYQKGGQGIQLCSDHPYYCAGTVLGSIVIVVAAPTVFNVLGVGTVTSFLLSGRARAARKVPTKAELSELLGFVAKQVESGSVSTATANKMGNKKVGFFRASFSMLSKTKLTEWLANGLSALEKIKHDDLSNVLKMGLQNFKFLFKCDGSQFESDLYQLMMRFVGKGKTYQTFGDLARAFPKAFVEMTAKNYGRTETLVAEAASAVAQNY